MSKPVFTVCPYAFIVSTKQKVWENFNPTKGKVYCNMRQYAISRHKCTLIMQAITVKYIDHVTVCYKNYIINTIMPMFKRSLLPPSRYATM
jgi:hypothetical protein